MESTMTPIRRGPRPKVETRENLLRAGMRLFHEAGYSASGIQDIVSAAQVPKGSFYNYFDSKEVFGKQIVDFYFNSGLNELRERLEDPDQPPIKRMQNYFDQRISDFENDDFLKGCLMGNLSLEVADHSESIRTSIAGHFKTWSKLFENCLAEAQRNGELSERIDSGQLAEFIMNSWEGALLRMRTAKSARPLKEFNEVVFNILLASK